VTEPPSDPGPGACFHGGAFFDAIGVTFDDLSRRRDVINADVLDAWFPPSPRIVAAIAPHLEWLISTSPPTGCEGLVRTISEVRGVPEPNVLVGAGSSELIYLALRRRLRAGDRTLLLSPTYGEYGHVLSKVVGCRVDRFDLRRDEGYRIDAARLAERLREGYDLVVIVNPNSPTGVHCDGIALESAIRGAPGATGFWIDETYVDYAGPGQSLERFAAALPNVVVCKSMSKVYALSGMRAAYLVASAATVADLRSLTPPWAVGLVAQVAAVEALRDGTYYEGRWAETHSLRADLERRLAADLGADVVHGVANFVLFHLPAGAPAPSVVAERCRARKLFVRDLGEMGEVGRTALRVAVKDAATNGRMLSILREAILG
jgi:histidinol-phosphate/aromatic aminotransferase/cobyric acid decarboxylase-like protein